MMFMKQPARIIIRMPNWLGDAVMATPILEDVKTKWPNSHLAVLCHDSIASLLTTNPYIDEFLVFSRASRGIAQEKKRIYSLLQQRSFDLGILLTGSFSSAWWFWKGGVQSRLGYKTHFRTPLLTTRVPVSDQEEKQHLVITYKELLIPLGIPVSTTSPRLYLEQKELDEAKKQLDGLGITEDHILIGINPLAAYGDAKCWPANRFRELTAKLLQNPKIRVIYFGDNSGVTTIDTIIHGFDNKAISLAGKTTLRELIALTSACQCFLTNDSGPMHIAAALNTPLVAIFGSTNEIKTGPYGQDAVIHKHTLCSPCYLRRCPIDFRCMTSISVEEVLEAINQRISNDH